MCLPWFHQNIASHPEHLHHLVPKVVDNLHGDAAGRRLGERPGGVAVQGFPGFLVYLCLQRCPQRLVGIVGAEEVGVADEEALLVVVAVDEPAGDAVGAVAADLAGVGVEHVDAVDLDLDLSVLGVEEVDVRLAEDDEEVAFAGVLEVVGHVEVGVHARLEDRHAAEFAELRGVGVVVEGAGDQDVEVGVGRFANRRNEIGAGDGAELRADEDARPSLEAGVAVAFDVGSLGADEVAGPGSDAREGDTVLLVRLLHAGGFEVVEDHPGEVLLLPVPEIGFGDVVDKLVVLVDAEQAVRRKAFHGEGAGDADLLVVLTGLVVEVFVVGLGGGGGVDLLLPGDALLPPAAVQISGAGFPRIAGPAGHVLQRVLPAQLLVQHAQRCGFLGVRASGLELVPRLGGLGGPGVARLAGNLPFFIGAVERGVQLRPQRLQGFLELLPDHVDLGVVGDGLQGDVGDALVHEALADVVVRGRFRGGLAGNPGFLDLAVAAVGEQVVGVAGPHDAGAGQREGDAGGVDGDPAAAPLLGDVRGGAGAAGRVENEVAGVGGH